MTEMLPPTSDTLQALADAAFREIPPELSMHIRGVAILVEDFPSPEVERDMGLQSPFDLLGLYQGVPLTEKSSSDSPGDLDRIFLYRRPILDYWAENETDLRHIVRHVLIHEIGHHFGFSDEEMELLENQMQTPPD